VGYFDNKPNLGPDTILFSNLPETVTGFSFVSVIFAGLISFAVTTYMGVRLAKNSKYHLHSSRGEYTVINI
jgi:hypothetical protein